MLHHSFFSLFEKTRLSLLSLAFEPCQGVFGKKSKMGIFTPWCNKMDVNNSPKMWITLWITLKNVDNSVDNYVDNLWITLLVGLALDFPYRLK